MHAHMLLDDTQSFVALARRYPALVLDRRALRRKHELAPEPEPPRARLDGEVGEVWKQRGRGRGRLSCCGRRDRCCRVLRPIV